MVRLFAKVIPVVGFVFLSLYASWAAAEEVHYTYDDSGQLLRVGQGTGTIIDYSYDALGNRLAKTTSLSSSSNTPPENPVLISPANAATDINSVGSSLEWTGGADPDSGNKVFYDVYFGESPQPPLYKGGLATKSLALTALPLRSLTTYYWKVVARDNLNAKSASQVWSFTTGNNVPSSPSNLMPRDNSYVLADDVYLAWSASVDLDGYDSVTYDVYFGTAANPPLVASNTTATGYHAGTLSPEVTYYWQVVAKDNNGAVSAGPVLSFTTLDPSHIVTSVTLTSNTTFTGDHGPYIIRGNLIINQGVTLTIEPGAVVKLDTGANIIVNGTLLAQGTADETIVFTSYKDDSFGRDVNGDGTATVAAPGDWGGIQFGATSSSSDLANCIVQYGGYGGFGNIYNIGSSPTMSRITARWSSNQGVYINSGAPIIQDSTITENGTAAGHYEVYVVGGTPRITNTRVVSARSSWVSIPADVVGSVNLAGSTFVDPGDVPGYITVIGGNISRDAIWPAFSVPYRLTGAIEVYGIDGADLLTTLTINPGAILKFDPTTYLRVGYYNVGALIAKGTADQRITFTSSKESPAPGNWNAIFFQTKASATSILEHCTIEYGGYGGYGNIYVDRAAPTISKTTIRKSSYHGIYVASDSPVIKDATITENGTATGHYGVYVVSGSPQITNSRVVTAYNSWISIPADVVGSVNLAGSTFVDPGDVPGYITVIGGTISHDATWPAISVPYRITGVIEVYGTDGADSLTTLTISPGAILKFDTVYLRTGYYGPGALVARGTESLPITLTSSKAVPVAGDWYGIHFQPKTASSSILEHCRVEYGGYGGSGSIYVNGSSPTITSTTVRKSSNYGIYINSGAPVIQSSTIMENGSAAGHYGVYVFGGTPQIINSRIVSGYSSWISIPVDVVGSVGLTGSTFVDPSDVPGYITVVGGTISRDATWQAYSAPYRITGNIELRGTDGSDALTTLTINPGATLRFDNVYFRIGYTVPGALVARGTETQPITFTSSKASPAAGNWDGLYFYSKTSPTSTLEHCIVEYGGSGGYGNFYVNGSAPTIANTIVRKSSNYGLYLIAGAPIIRDSTITENGTAAGHYGVYVIGGTPQITSTRVVSTYNSWVYIPPDIVGAAGLTGCTFVNGSNATGYVSVAGGTISRDATWQAINAPYRITGNIELRGTDGSDALTTLTINPGATLRFDNVYFRIGYTVPGALVARGTETQPITFTSSKDSPAAGNWDGLYFYSKTSPTSTLEHCIVEYGGSGGYGNFYVNGSAPTIASTIVRKSSNYGIYVVSGSPNIQSGQITNNPTYGIYNAGTTVVTAKNVWWGHATGPLDSSNDTTTGGWYNPTGLGNKVTDRVAYQPWATGSTDTDGDGLSDADEINVYGTDSNKSDTDEDGLSDYAEVFIYGTDPLKADTDGDGIKDGEEVAFWGANWNADTDGDGIINLLDRDSDNDGYSDGVEKAQGTDPADDTSLPEVIVYEDAQDGLILGWQVSDATPAGALATNVFDSGLQSNAISLIGDGLYDSFRLYTEDGAEWNNENHKVISWTMNFSGDYVLTVLVQTSGGPRLLTYTPEDVSNLGSDAEVHHGLGAASKDGTWQTFTVNLQYDLQEAQPGNQVLSILGFEVSGSGMVDDIKTLHQFPAGLDTDGDTIPDLAEINTYGTHPYLSDTDNDSLADGAELAYWNAAWGADPDQDGLVNLLDPDADGDGFMDGIELTQGTDPANAASFPVQ